MWQRSCGINHAGHSAGAAASRRSDKAHNVPHVCGEGGGAGEDECTHLHNLISSIRPPLPTLVSPKTPSWTGLPCKGQVLSAVCCWGWGAWTKGAFIAVGSGCLRTDNGLILLILKQIAVCSLPFQGEERAVGAGDWGSCGRDEGENSQRYIRGSCRRRQIKAGKLEGETSLRHGGLAFWGVYILTHAWSQQLPRTWSRHTGIQVFFAQKTFQVSSDVGPLGWGMNGGWIVCWFKSSCPGWLTPTPAGTCCRSPWLLWSWWLQCIIYRGHLLWGSVGFRTALCLAILDREPAWPHANPGRDPRWFAAVKSSDNVASRPPLEAAASTLFMYYCSRTVLQSFHSLL